MCGIICSLRAECREDTDNAHDRPAKLDDAFRDLFERLKVVNSARGMVYVVKDLFDRLTTPRSRCTGILSRPRPRNTSIHLWCRTSQYIASEQGM